jgi:hypothetical protein
MRWLRRPAASRRDAFIVRPRRADVFARDTRVAAAAAPASCGVVATRLSSAASQRHAASARSLFVKRQRPKDT